MRPVVIRKLGQLKDPAALPALLRFLDDPDYRGDAMQAISDLGDARAIPAIESLLNDRSEVWQEDNHGPMVHVGDFARDTIARLRSAPTAAVDAPRRK